ncbi:MAG: quinone oxidoreductase [Defluviicoccus sp.]|nr:quinone oxidoreductase [Defluviicoccus sp.]MDE0276944.1 quinone oxidoreductase [Defluviicoccus sp.]
MPMAAVIHEKGTPDVFRWEEVEVGAPGEGEVRIRNEAVGVNYVDTYHRRGMPHPWPVPPLPLVLGFEGAGIVTEVGEGVEGLSPGDRVGYAMPPHGAYSQERIYPAEKAVKVPDGIDARAVAATMLKGLTAQYLLRRTYRVEPGDVILVHAAAGGMGLILCQWGRHLGATVIGTVSTEEKAEQARAAGCDHAVVHDEGDFVATVKEVTNGEGCAVVYESIGKDTFRRSMDCLRPLGMMASYGHASGAPDPVDVIELGARGSLFLTRPAIMHYMARREDLVAGAEELFDVVLNGAVEPAVNHLYPLSEAAEAHRAIEARRTTGATVLLPFE